MIFKRTGRDAGELRGVCNPYSITKGQAAIRELFEGITDAAGSLQALPEVYPDYQAPVRGQHGRWTGADHDAAVHAVTCPYASGQENGSRCY